MKCAKNILYGATLFPIGMCAFLTVAMGPAIIAEQFLGISPMWGVLASMVALGAIGGVITCIQESAS